MIIQETLPGLDSVNHWGKAISVTGVRIKCFLLRRNSERRAQTHTIRDKKKTTTTQSVNIFVRKILEQDSNVKPTTHYISKFLKRLTRAEIMKEI